MATPEQQAATMIANMPERRVNHWSNGEIVKWLKSDFQITHDFANLISHKTLQARTSGNEDVDLEAVQYQGAKANLKPMSACAVKSSLD